MSRGSIFFESAMRRALLVVVPVFGLLSCGGSPAGEHGTSRIDDGDASVLPAIDSGKGDSRGSGAVDSGKADSPAEASGQCVESPLVCVEFCGSDYLNSAECRAGRWVCPAAFPFDESACPPSCGLVAPCCSPDGGQEVQSTCADGGNSVCPAGYTRGPC